MKPEHLWMAIACLVIGAGTAVWIRSDGTEPAAGLWLWLWLSSLNRCTWNAIDFRHGTITSLVNKNKVPLIFAQADPTMPRLASVMTILQRWHAYQGMPAGNQPIVSDLGCTPTKEAAALRRDLKLARITRAHLFERAEHIEPLRFHDLKASFVTRARRAGKDSGWISDRSGHLTQEVMQRYDRGRPAARPVSGYQRREPRASKRAGSGAITQR